MRPVKRNVSDRMNICFLSQLQCSVAIRKLKLLTEKRRKKNIQNSLTLAQIIINNRKRMNRNNVFFMLKKHFSKFKLCKEKETESE